DTMRRARFLLTLPGIAVAGTAIWASGCGTTEDDCLSGLRCNPYRDAAEDSSQGGHIEPSCTGKPTDPDPATMTLKLYNPDCAVFVLANAPGSTQDGTMANPYPALQT